MALSIPSLPPGSTTTVAIQSNALDLKPTFGGPIQRASRLGDKWTIEVTCRPMNYTQAMTLTAVLVQGSSEKVIFDFPQPGLAIGNPGTPRVNGASQLGNSLIADGFTANYPIRQGQFFSIVIGGIRYLHQARSAVTANASGQVTIPVYPLLRKSPADNDVLEFAQPKIEGWLKAGGQNWTISLVRAVGVTFQISEGA